MAIRLVPAARPDMVLEFAAALLATHGVRDAVALVGRRGYYRDTMGAPGVQERGLYDDAIALVAPGLPGGIAAFNANCDPSLGRPGIAVLLPGVWTYRLGIHGLSKPRDRQYEALVQAAPVTVARDPARAGARPALETGWFGINIHRGGYVTTSSLGCQTVYPDQWPEFIGAVKRAMAAHGQTTIRYVLTQRGDDE
jgi:lysozyme